MADDKATDERRFDFSSTMLAALDEVRSEGFQRKQPTLSEASYHIHACRACSSRRIAFAPRRDCSSTIQLRGLDRLLPGAARGHSGCIQRALVGRQHAQAGRGRVLQNRRFTKPKQALYRDFHEISRRDTEADTHEIMRDYTRHAKGAQMWQQKPPQPSTRQRTDICLHVTCSLIEVRLM